MGRTKGMVSGYEAISSFVEARAAWDFFQTCQYAVEYRRTTRSTCFGFGWTNVFVTYDLLLASP